MRRLFALLVLLSSVLSVRPTSCQDVKAYDSKSGIHTLFLSADFKVKVYCDQSTDNGGWTVNELTRFFVFSIIFLISLFTVGKCIYSLQTGTHGAALYYSRLSDLNCIVDTYILSYYKYN